MYVYVMANCITDIEMNSPAISLGESGEWPSTKVEPYVTHLPFYPTLKAACHDFSEVGVPDETVEWIDVSNEMSHLDKSMFVVKAMGNSMEPKISDGDYCVFTNSPAGSREGEIVLAELDRIIASEDSACTINGKHSVSTKSSNAQLAEPLRQVGFFLHITGDLIKLMIILAPQPVRHKVIAVCLMGKRQRSF